MTDRSDTNMEFDGFIDNYYSRFVETINKFDKSMLPAALEIFLRISEAGGTIWVAGNGGSAAISDHTCCDVTKLTYVEGKPPVKSISLVSNGPLLTALANDYAYEDVFWRQLEYYMGPNDAVLLVSSSGNSPNVVKACEYANSRGVPTIAFTGFSGGKLKELAQVSVWIPVDNYGMTEDIHQSLIHVITQYINSKS